jgi:hypothetical protein
MASDSSTNNMTSRARPIKRRTRPPDRENYNPTYLPFKKRLDHFTWSWFECTMSTGAIAALLGQQPYSFTGLKTIGMIFFILDIVLFLAFSACITYRFIHNRGSLELSLHHPFESGKELTVQTRCSLLEYIFKTPKLPYKEHSRA